MLKLRRYLKPFAVSILAIIVLLFAQAMCELTMPDYMSNIVNVGINANGIEDGVPEAIREQEYEKLSVFMDEQQQQLFEEHYEKVSPSAADSEQTARYPLLSEETLYILEPVDEEQRAALNLALSDAELCVSGVNEMEKTLQEAMDDPQKAEALSAEQQQMLAMMQSMPQGTSLSDVLSQLPQEQIDQIKAEMTKLSDAMGQSSADTANAQYIRGEYEAIGMDVDAIQYSYLFTNGALMLALALGSAAAAVTIGFLASRIAAGMSRNLRRDVFAKVEKFSLAEFSRFSTNTLLTRTTGDIQQIQMVMVMMLRMVIYAPIIGIGALLKVLNSDADMTWIVALVIIVIIGIMGSAFAIVLPKFRITQKLMDRLNAVVREFLDGMPVIRAFNNQKIEEGKFEKANRDIMKNLLFVGRSMGLLMPLIMLVMNCTSILIVWVGSHQVDAGVMQIGDMMAYMQYTMQIIMAFMMITMMSIMIPRASVAAGRIAEVLESEPTIVDPKQPADFMEEKKGQVEFRDVSFRYPGAEEPVLHHLNFTAQPGKTTAFIGSTGSGKSTLINLVPRFFDVSEGDPRGRCRCAAMSRSMICASASDMCRKGAICSAAPSAMRYAKEDASEEDLRGAAQTAQAMEFIEASQRASRRDRAGRNECLRRSAAASVHCPRAGEEAGDLYL
ncbi:MAG: ABC transporter ATP-binding protein [Merdibacter sp.]